MASVAQPATSTPNQNTWEGFPEPRTTAPTISREDALALVADHTPELLIVDVRRTDYEGGAILGSVNLPAHSFYLNRRVLFCLCQRAGIEKVAFYCGSSNGRGPRCAGWFADYIADQHWQGGQGVQSLTLEGGIKGWVKGGPNYTKHMIGFEPEYWKQFE